MSQEKSQSSYSLKRYSKDECLICFESLDNGANIFEQFIYDDLICSDCRHEFSSTKVRHLNDIKVTTLYHYNEWASKLLIQYKELNDEALAPLFLYQYLKKLKRKYRGYILIPMPSTTKKTLQRGFIPVIKIFEHLNLPIVDVLEKTQEIDQKHLSLVERKELTLRLKDQDCNFNKVLLIDDVISSGQTISAAYKLLEKKCKVIKVLCIFNHELERN